MAVTGVRVRPRSRGLERVFAGWLFPGLPFGTLLGPEATGFRSAFLRGPGFVCFSFPARFQGLHRRVRPAGCDGVVV